MSTQDWIDVLALLGLLCFFCLLGLAAALISYLVRGGPKKPPTGGPLPPKKR